MASMLIYLIARSHHMHPSINGVATTIIGNNSSSCQSLCHFKTRGQLVENPQWKYFDQKKKTDGTIFAFCDILVPETNIWILMILNVLGSYSKFTGTCSGRLTGLSTGLKTFMPPSHYPLPENFLTNLEKSFWPTPSPICTLKKSFFPQITTSVKKFLPITPLSS